MAKKIIRILCVFTVSVLLGVGAIRIIYPLRYRNDLCAVAEDFCLSPSLVAAVICVESHFDAEAQSRKGAVGLMQLLPSTAAWMAQKLGIEQYALTNPHDNVTLGCAYLAYLAQKYSDETTILAAYNAGEGRVDEWLKNAEYSRGGALVCIPFAETAAYCKKVLRTQKYYGFVYGL